MAYHNAGTIQTDGCVLDMQIDSARQWEYYSPTVHRSDRVPHPPSHISDMEARKDILKPHTRKDCINALYQVMPYITDEGVGLERMVSEKRVPVDNYQYTLQHTQDDRLEYLYHKRHTPSLLQVPDPLLFCRYHACVRVCMFVALYVYCLACTCAHC
jgi:hypothetical protein